MNWTRLILVVIGGGIVTSLTDWLFACDWLHRRFTYPEIWRQGSESRAIAVSSALPFLTSAAFVAVAVWLGINSMASAVELAIGIWLIGPLPLILTNAVWVKFHRVFVVSYAISWLVKLVVLAVAVWWFLP
jgi:hypothetical protein